MRARILRSIAAAAAAGASFSSAAALAQVPPTITDQGRLYDQNSNPIDTTASSPDCINVLFSLYSASSGGVPVWSEQQCVVFEEGYYSVELGSVTPITYGPSPAIINGSTLYFGIAVGSDPEMTPRGTVASVPYAMLAGDVTGDIHPTSVSIAGVGPVINSSGQWVGSATGLQGPAGPAGPAGAAGANGATGAQGAAGAQGSAGPQGPAGAAGAQGPIGPTGAAGTNGTNGATGAQGPIGPTGAAGTNGTNGATGAQGPIGPTGAAGTNGTNGINGATGATGAAGANGTNGINGATGATGPAGTNGTNGTNGVTGATGATGPQGATGNGLLGNTATAPTCGSSQAGQIYFNTTTSIFYGCNGTVWVPFVSPSSSCGRFDTGATGAWTTVAANPFGTGMGLSGYLPANVTGATLYLLNGSSFDGYSSASNTYTAEAAPPVAFEDYPSIAYSGSSLWAFASGDVIQYNIAANTWSTVKTGVTTPRASQTTADDAGNLWSFQSESVLQAFNTTTGTVTTHTLTTALAGASEQRIVWDSCAQQLYFADFGSTALYAYNPSTGVQTTLAAFPNSNGIQDGFCGDHSGHIFSVTIGVSTPYQYNVATNAWVALPSGGPIGDYNSACGVSADGYLYATDLSTGTAMYRIKLQ